MVVDVLIVVDSRLIFAVHAFVAAGLFGLGVIRIRAGGTVGGSVNVVMAAMVLLLGTYIARK